MDRHRKLMHDILTKKGDANIPFSDLCRMLCLMGFKERIKGDHHIFTMAGMNEIMNLQPLRDKAKPYQVRQVRDLMLRYDLKLEE